MSKKPEVSNQRILQLARLRDEKKAALDAARAELQAVDDQIVPLVEAHGAYPPKATRTKVLSAGDGTELRVTIGQEIRVDGSLALRLRAYLREHGLGRIFRKFFRRVDSYVLAEGAHQYAGNLGLAASDLGLEVYGVRDSRGRARARAGINEIRRLFAAAIEEKNQSPAIEVRRPDSKERAA